MFCSLPISFMFPVFDQDSASLAQLVTGGLVLALMVLLCILGLLVLWGNLSREGTIGNFTYAPNSYHLILSAKCIYWWMSHIDSYTFILKLSVRHKKKMFFIKKSKNGKQLFLVHFKVHFFFSTSPHYAKMTLKLLFKIGKRKQSKKEREKGKLKGIWKISWVSITCWGSGIPWEAAYFRDEGTGLWNHISWTHSSSTIYWLRNHGKLNSLFAPQFSYLKNGNNNVCWQDQVTYSL